MKAIYGDVAGLAILWFVFVFVVLRRWIVVSFGIEDMPRGAAEAHRDAGAGSSGCEGPENRHRVQNAGGAARLEP
jgi:hypothetical protein